MNKVKERMDLIKKGISILDKIEIIKFFINRKKINGCKVKITKNSTIFVRKNSPNDLWMCSPEMDKKIFDYIKKSKPERILDIGANIGRHTLQFSENQKSKIISFEPQKDTFEALKRNVYLNKRKNVRLFNIGLFDENKEVELNICDSNCGANSIALKRDGKKEKIFVQKLDDFLKKENFSPDFIKIDVEGAELNVLKGAINTIKKNGPIIYLEILKDKRGIFKLLEDNNYSLNYFGGDNFLAIKKNE